MDVDPGDISDKDFEAGYPSCTSDDGETYYGVDTIITYDIDGDQHVEVV